MGLIKTHLSTVKKRVIANDLKQISQDRSKRFVLEGNKEMVLYFPSDYQSFSLSDISRLDSIRYQTKNSYPQN